jgi:phage shock protein C
MDTTRKLYRSKTDRKLGGVCGGLGEYLGADPTIIRVLFIVLAVLGGAGLIIYLAMWLIVPAEP